jgi:hypothetical protein
MVAEKMRIESSTQTRLKLDYAQNQHGNLDRGMPDSCRGIITGERVGAGVGLGHTFYKTLSMSGWRKFVINLTLHFQGGSLLRGVTYQL